MGLGRQMAEGLAEMGADLVLCARKKERCEEAAEALRSLGVQTLALGCDVKDKTAIQQVVDATLARFGRIDILVNNAGASWGAPVEEMTLEQWDKVLSTNLTGTFLFCQAVGKAMARAEVGKDHQHCIGCGSAWRLHGTAGNRLPRKQRRRDCIHQRSGVQVGTAQHPGQCDRSRMVSHPHVGMDHRAAQGFPAGEDSAGAIRRRSRSERRGGVPGIGRFGVRDRARASRRWRPDRLVRIS